MNINEAKSVLLRTHLGALRHGTRARAYHWESGPGVGKSDGVEQNAYDLCLTINEPVGVVPFMLASITSPDVKGFMMPVKNTDAEGHSRYDTVFTTAPWYPCRDNMIVFVPNPDYDRSKPDAAPKVLRFDMKEWDGPIPCVGILFLDEFSQAEDDVKKPAAELIYKGAVGSTSLPIGWRVVSAGNRMKDRSGVQRELMFVINRRAKIKIDPSLPAWVSWANQQAPADRPHYLTISFAQKNPNLVFRDAVPDGYDQYCTARSLCMMDAELRSLRTEDEEKRGVMPTDDMARETCAAWIGEAEAAQYFTHLKFADEIPDMSEIEKDPSGAKVPKGMDAQMVCGYMIAHGVTPTNASAIIAYLNRLNVEMQVLTVRAIMAQGDRSRPVVSNSGFGAWVIKNRELLQASRS